MYNWIKETYSQMIMLLFIYFRQQKDVMDVPIMDPVGHKGNEKQPKEVLETIFVGSKTRELLSEVSSKSKDNFFTDARSFYKNAVVYLRKQLPVTTTTLMAYAEVADVSLRETSDFSSLEFFLQKYPVLVMPG